ncbi:CoB--CoM heterodisulfide reductase subunit B [Methanobacterium paludis]|uniref:CoB/CoM heterodisulfide reductase, subunit B n=1 Tax=Methanobacterium paludis (strain DSM 25820 / JCM 18151 / SWAN1) TaxID=868131 RepID=F6D1T9_METPW|nr:CoB--CoM heterodisulfide reductase subunit B [Methanobacterium paludis]AEG18566.1 CoB/CoM heterodisulfide reductase, subunit B [Methanobacterium paludis]
MAFAYFLGCIMNNRYPGIEKATRIMMDKLGVGLEDMEGASCCPAPGVFGSFDKTTWASIAARNITIAEDMGMDVLTECNGCFGSLRETNNLLKEDEEFKGKINGVLEEVGREFKGEVNVRHFAEVLYNDVGLDKLSEAVTTPLNLNVAVHYGCHFLKPRAEVGIDNPMKPTILDELVEVTGAKSVPYKEKMMCCGAGGGLRARDLDVTLDYTKEKLQNMSDAGVDAIVNVCPFCHLQFDVGQKEVNEKYGTNFQLPVFHLAQLYGLAMGLSPEEITVDVQQISADPAIKKLDIITGGE